MLEKSFERESTCRTCTKTGLELSPLFAKQDAIDGISYSDMISQCTMFQAEEHDELPHLICLDCQAKAKNAYDFKKQCEESQSKLLAMLELAKDVRASRVNDAFCVDNKIPDVKEISRNKLTRKAAAKHKSCEKCSQTFVNLEKLKEHVKLEHTDPRHKCPKCSKEFIRMGHLTRHMNKMHGNDEEESEMVDIKGEGEPEKQSQCTLTSPSKVEIDFEFGTDHGDDDDPSYTDDTELHKPVEASEANANAAKFSSDLDDETQEDSSIKQEQTTIQPTSPSLKTHLDSSRRFQCDQCHKAFKRKSHLKQHSLCHTKIKPYQCTICQKRFGRPDNLKVHMSNHGQKHFQCNTCDRSFGQAYLLKRHKDQTHSEEKPFLCSECGQRFVRNGDLAVHMRRHTGEKPYKCQYCNKGFTRSTEVYVHERYHTGEKRHVCSICGKAFQRPYNLLVHVRTHTGERPYQCPHCPKNFAQCSDLKAHIRRHTGERYRCDQCGMGFIHVFVLNQHKLTVHGIEVPSRIKRVVKLSTDTQ